MAKNNHPKNNKHANQQPSRQHTSKPPKCGTCDKLHNGKCWHENPPTKATSNCSYCGKKGHDESVCRMKTTINTCSHCGKKGHDENVCRMKNNIRTCSFCGKKGHDENVCRVKNTASTCSRCGEKGHEESECYLKRPSKKPKRSERDPWAFGLVMDLVENESVQFNGRWAKALTSGCQRERDRSAVSFPLTLVGSLAKLPQESGPRAEIWLEDSGNDAIMCLHDCRKNFCFKRFANKCANQLEMGVIQVSQSDEEAIWQTMTNYGTPNNGFGNSPWMDVDEVL